MHGFESLLALLKDVGSALSTPSGQEVAAWFLAWVFAWSGATKLRRPALAAMAMIDFRVARRVDPRLGLGLGALEVALAIGLASGLGPAVAASAAAGILWLFTFLIARSLISGERFPCYCFGNVDSEVSGRTLGRTLMLALLASTAAVLAAGRGNQAFGWTGTDLLHAVAALAALSGVALAATIPVLVSSSRETRLSIEGLSDSLPEPAERQ